MDVIGFHQKMEWILIRPCSHKKSDKNTLQKKSAKDCDLTTLRPRFFLFAATSTHLLSLSLQCSLSLSVVSLGCCSHRPPQPHPPPAAPAPWPYNRASSFGQTPSVNGRKKAVICGISYKRTKHELKGCINDAKCMKYLLINKFKFPESSILMLTGKVFLISSFFYLIVWINYYSS